MQDRRDSSSEQSFVKNPTDLPALADWYQALKKQREEEIAQNALYQPKPQAFWELQRIRQSNTSQSSSNLGLPQAFLELQRLRENKSAENKSPQAIPQSQSRAPTNPSTKTPSDLESLANWYQNLKQQRLVEKQQAWSSKNQQVPEAFSILQRFKAENQSKQAQDSMHSEQSTNSYEVS